MSIIINPIKPIAFEFGIIKIYWYGIAYFAGIFLGIFIIKKLDLKYRYFEKSEQIDSFMVYIIIGILLGGRFGYIIFYNLAFYLENINQITQVWKGGMSFHGAAIGLGLSSYIFSRIYKVRFFHLTDYLCFVAPVGIFFGRMANFINRELIGRETDWKYGVQFVDESVVRHASQVYEAFGEGLFLVILMVFLQLKYQILRSYSAVTSIFLVSYGIVRFSVEFFRQPDEQIGFFFEWITEGQILCVLMIVLGVFLLNKAICVQRNPKL